GDSSPATAWAVLFVMKAVAARLWGTSSLAGRHVCIRGAGQVGGALATHLAEEGAKLTIPHVDASKANAQADRRHATLFTPGTVQERITPAQAADRLAEDRIASVSRVRLIRGGAG